MDESEFQKFMREIDREMIEAGICVPTPPKATTADEIAERQREKLEQLRKLFGLPE